GEGTRRLGVGQLNRLLRVHSRIALDTSVFIYQLQANPKYVGLTDEIFVWLQRAKSQGVTSTITLTELLVQPYRARNQQQADEIYGLLSTFPNLAWIAPSLEIADTAARLRAAHACVPAAVFGSVARAYASKPLWQRLSKSSSGSSGAKARKLLL